VIDTDEFVWFNTSKFLNLHDLIVRESLFHKAAMLGMRRSFYNVNLCDNTEEGRSIWDVPYHRLMDTWRQNGELHRAGKYLLQPEYLGNDSIIKEHTARNLLGREIRLSGDKAHVKHFRGFASWNGRCENGLGRKMLERKIQPDPKNPCFSKWGEIFAESYNFTKDVSFSMWQDLIQRKML